MGNNPNVHHGILPSNEKEQNMNTCYNMDKLQKYTKKPEAKHCIIVLIHLHKICRKGSKILDYNNQPPFIE